MRIHAGSNGCASAAIQPVAKRIGKWRRRALIVGSGLLLAAGQAPFSFPIGVVVGLPVLAALFLRSDGTGEGFRLGWLAGSAYFAGSMFWIVEPFFVEPEIYAWMSPFALIFLSGGLALFWGTAFAVAARYQGAARLFMLVVTLTLAEFVRAHIFTGFPWGLMA